MECSNDADNTALYPSQGSAGIDPHFSVLLMTGHQLCFTVQGEQGFVFNLIYSPQLTVNAFFIPDKFKDEITWIGSLAVIINKTKLRFEASSKIVHINEQNILSVRNGGLHITLLNGEIHNTVISSFSSSYVLIDIKDMGLHFSVEYLNQHLDIIYTNKWFQLFISWTIRTILLSWIQY